MTLTFRDILCNKGSWVWDTKHGSSISFSEDGVGTIECQVELNVFIAAEFDWRVDEATLGEPIDMGSESSSLRLLSSFDIELTLTTRPSRRFAIGTKANENALTKNAFRKKQYSVRLEQGNFIPPNLKDGTPDEFVPRFALRLVFDKSPYPPLEEWKEPDMGPAALRFWECKEFTGFESPVLKRRPITDERSKWNSCVIG